MINVVTIDNFKFKAGDNTYKINKMPRNIKKIGLWDDNPQKDRISNVVKIDFNFPCSWTILDIDDLMEILKYWIIGEEMKYPLDKDIGLHNGDMRGRNMIKKKIDDLFKEDFKK